MGGPRAVASRYVRGPVDRSHGFYPTPLTIFSGDSVKTSPACRIAASREVRSGSLAVVQPLPCGPARGWVY